MRVEVDTTLQFADLQKEEERRFFKVSRKYVRTGVNRLRKRVRANLRGIGTGVTYTIGGKVHRASAPGEDPAKLTGSLARSMRASVKIKRKDGAIVGSVHPSRSQWKKAYGLEFGATVGNWSVAARSFMRRAMVQEEPAIGRDLAGSVEEN